jgi:TonB-linked SusC/RagA family outer membrane protein
VAASAQDTTHAAQAGTISGVVRARDTEVLLAAATVRVRNTLVRVETDALGAYALRRLSPGIYRLRAQLLGYAPADTTVVLQEAQQLVVDFRLAPSAIELNPVVAIGYGTARKQDLTGSVASVQGTDIATNPVERADQALAGRVPGLQVQTTNAQPDAELRIRVRGGNSLSASNAPLVVIDGVIGADLSLINPSDIETFDILKDASATAIYGARGGNGVIMVTTKAGQGPIHLDYSTYVGMQSTTKHIDVLNADQFARLYMRNPTHNTSVTFDTLTSLPTTDWQNVVYRAAPIQNHELRISGSREDTRLMFSANWYDQQGVLLGSDVTRGSLRFNLDQNVSTRFRLGTRVSYSRTVANDARVNSGYGSAGGPVTMEALRFAPTISVRDSTGTFSGPLLPGANDNPMAIIDLQQDKTRTGYGIGMLFGEYDLVPGVTLRSSLSYTSNDFLEQQYTSRQLQAALNQGQANLNNSTATTWLSENTATLHRTLGKKHDFTLLGGWSAQQTTNTANNEQGVGFTNDDLGYNRLNVAQTVTGGSSASRQRFLSFFGRVNYSYAGKYLLTATLRDDGSSKFAVNNKWALFPSAAVAWRASDEPFLRRLAPTVSDLKLRFSAGQSGSEAINSYNSLAAWSVGSPYAIGTTTYFNGATINRFANPALHWETTTQYDLGLDLGLFADRASFTADVYDKTTHDLLYDKLLPYITGFDSYIRNIGKIRNRGLELALDTRPTVGAVQVRLGGTLSLNRSKVLDLGGDQEFFLAGANS